MTRVPTPLIVAVPPASKVVLGIPATVNCVTVKSASILSTSVSLVSTLPINGVSSVTVNESSTATGSSFTGVTVMLTVSLSVSGTPVLSVGQHCQRICTVEVQITLVAQTRQSRINICFATADR